MRRYRTWEDEIWEDETFEERQSLIRRLLDAFMKLPIMRHKKRRCKYPNCNTVLHPYHKGNYCYQHTLADKLRQYRSLKEKVLSIKHKLNISDGMRKWHKRRKDAKAIRNRKEWL